MRPIHMLYILYCKPHAAGADLTNSVVDRVSFDHANLEVRRPLLALLAIVGDCCRLALLALRAQLALLALRVHPSLLALSVHPSLLDLRVHAPFGCWGCQ